MKRRIRSVVFYSIIILVVMVSGIIGHISKSTDIETNAKMIASFIQSEYERELIDNKAVEINKIIKMAERLDEHHLTISYNDSTDKVLIEKELDNKYIKFESFSLEKGYDN